MKYNQKYEDSIRNLPHSLMVKIVQSISDEGFIEGSKPIKRTFDEFNKLNPYTKCRHLAHAWKSGYIRGNNTLFR